jgi:DNA gyrase subunit B
MAKKKQAKGSEYTAGQIQVLKGLEAVRKRPGMYIGSTSARGLHHLVYEVVDNAIDEAMAGYCTRIDRDPAWDDSVTVRTTAAASRSTSTPPRGVPGVELAMTTLHAGGKFDKNTYKVSGGLHGVGVSVVNALSSTSRSRSAGTARSTASATSAARRTKELEKVGKARRTSGDQGHLQARSQIFTELVFSYEVLSNRMREMAFLNKGLRIVTRDERNGQEPRGVVSTTAGSPSTWSTCAATASRCTTRSVTSRRSKPEAEIELALQYDQGFSENTHTFVNNINTHEGGMHLTGLKAALTRTINDYARRNNIFKKDESLSGDDVREGLTCVLSVRVMEPQFEGQTKTKLGNSEVRGAVEAAVNEQLSIFLEENPSAAKAIIEKSLQAARARRPRARRGT